MQLLTVLTIFSQTLYGTGIDSDMLDRCGLAFVALCVCEVFVRMVVTRFFNVQEDFYEQATNRFDFGTCATCVAILTLKFVTDGTLQFSAWTTAKPNDAFRLSIVISTFRIFSSVKSIFLVVASLVVIAIELRHVVIIMVLLSYSYACVGCALFAGQFKYLLDYRIPNANFNSFLDATAVLFQLSIGVGWVDVMGAAEATSQVLGVVSVYFISYIFIMSILLYQLLAGVIINGYSDLYSFVIAASSKKLSVREFKQVESMTSFYNIKIITCNALPAILGSMHNSNRYLFLKMGVRSTIGYTMRRLAMRLYCSLSV